MMDCGILATGVFVVQFLAIWNLHCRTNHALVLPESNQCERDALQPARHAKLPDNLKLPAAA